MSNMVEHLQMLARERASQTALIAVSASGETRLDYAALDLATRALAAELQSRFAPGDRALLLLDNDQHYVVGFLACLYAGLTAVPVFPPASARPQHLQRLVAIAADCEARCVLTSSAIVGMVGSGMDGFGQAVVLAVDSVDPALAASWRVRHPRDSEIAFLQYTSGSTSTPKGVMVSHGNLMANERAIQEGMGVGADDVFASWLPLYHDMGLIGGLLQPLHQGIAVVLMSPAYFLESPVRWLQAISRHRVTVSGAPDFAYRLCLERVGEAQRVGLDLSSWRLAFSGAEPVRHDTLAEFVACFAPVGFKASAVYPCYGLAEATLFVTGGRRDEGLITRSFSASSLAVGKPVPDAQGTTLVSCGRVASDHELEIVEPDTLARLSDGQVGEIWASGPSIAQGYWRRQEASAEAFVERDGRRWLRTGDLGFTHEGHLYIAGRRKDVIILRGQNLYPQDIERAIEAEVEAVRKGRVAAFAVQTAEGAEGVGVAVEVSHGLQKLVSGAALVEALSQAVSAVCHEPLSVALLLNPGALPKTSSGKLQRGACRQGWIDRSLDAYAVYEHGRFVAGEGAAAVAVVQAPQGEVEVELAAIWSEVLRQRAQVAAAGALGRDAHFFAQGGNSLGAVQVAARVADRWVIAFAAQALFEHPRLQACAQEIERRLADGQYQRSGEIAVLSAAERMGPLPVSLSQRGMWLTWALDPASPAYNVAVSLRLRGLLNEVALRQSLVDLVARHEPLRTVFQAGADGEPRQLILSGESFEPVVVDLRSLPDAERAAQVQAQVTALASAAFDLSADMPWRATLIRVRDDEVVLVLVAHHIAADGWSLQVAVSELMARYEALVEGKSEALPALAVQFADHVAWQRQSLEGGELNRQLAYWRERLGQEHPVLALPLDRPRSSSRAVSSAGVFKRFWPKDLSAQLHGLARSQEATLYMVMLALFKLVMYRVTGQNDVRVGAPTANRDRTETHGLIGYLVNVPVLRTTLDARQPFDHLLRQVKAAVVEAQAHADVPFDLLVDALQPERQPGVHPLFQVKCTQQPGLVKDDRFADLAMALDELPVGPAHFDLSLDFTDHPDGLRSLWVYDAAVLDEATVQGWADALQAFAVQFLLKPQSLLAELDMPGPVSILQATAIDFEAPDVLALWSRAVASHPQRTAIRHEDEAWSYAQLDAQAEHLAGQLRERGVRAEGRVALHAGRSCEFALGVLAVLKAGGAYVPLDPALPAERLGHQLNDSGAALLLSVSSAGLASGASGVPVLPLAFQSELSVDALIRPSRKLTHPAQAAYVIYTSGSTGQPKGVVVSHGALSNYVQGVLSRLDLPGDVDSMAMVSTVAADLGHTSLFGALCSGRCLHLISQERAFDPDRFAQYMAQHRVGVLKIVPSHLQALLNAADPGRVLPTHALIVGGEATPWALLDQVKSLRPDCRVINHYGPTESTVGILTQAGEEAHRGAPTLPIGQPVPNSQAWVLDADLNPVLQGVAGELYLGGPGLAQGYQGQARLTADRFVPAPGSVHGERLYRSGDRVRQLADGTLVFLGRVDDQVKIRGYRVEPREVAAVLLAQPEVREAEVLARHLDDGRAQLCAYVVPHDASREGPRFDMAALQARLAALLPDYMVPGALVELSAMPLNANGKVDRKALPAPASLSDQGAHEPPQGPVEEALAVLWRDLLGVALVNRHDNFFELGGDSILGLKLVARARKVGIRLLAKQIFAHPTVAGLAAVAADKAAPKPEGAIPVLSVAARSQGIRASHAQQRQWFLWQLAPQSSAYHIAGGLRLKGSMDVPALQAAFNALLARHESLRTVFSAGDDGSARQVIKAPYSLDIPLIDLSTLTGDAHQARLDEEARQQAEVPFDLMTGPLLRVALIRLAPDEHLLTIVMHHIVSDGWSMQVIMQEFAELYAAGVQGRAAKLPPVPIQYADYAVWQHAWLEAGEQARQLAYWRERLGSTHPVLQLPVDRPRTAALDHPAERHAFELNRDVAEAARRLAQVEGVTVFVVLLAAFQALLYRYTGQCDLRIGTFVANRARPETGPAVGFFVNTQVLAAQVHGRMPWRDVLAQARETVAGAQAHEELPFELVLDALRSPHGPSRNPLFQVMINHQRKDYDSLAQLPGLALQTQAQPGRPQRSQFELIGHALRSQFELTLETVEHPDGRLSGTLTYATDLLKLETVQRMVGHFQALLASSAAHPERALGDAGMLTDAEHTMLLGDWRGGRVGDRTGDLVSATDPAMRAAVHQRIEQQAERHPDRVAVICGDQQRSYAELNARANQVAHHLVTLGTSSDALIGVCMDRSWRMVVALLGILKAGAAYVPLDPGYPKDRLAYMLEDAAASIVLTDSLLTHRLPMGQAQVLCLDQLDAVLNDQRTSNPGLGVHPDHLVYCIYTSGSTGRPKGAINTHGGFANLLDWYLSDRVDGEVAPRVLLASSPSFDLTQKNIFGPLVGGGTLIVPAGDSLAMHAVIEAIEQRHPQRINCAPSVYRLLHEAAAASASVKTVVLGGEPIDADLMRSVANGGMSLVNSYGPTECADVAISFLRTPEDARIDMPIGQAIQQARIHILDVELNPVPVGVAGEIHIGGAGVARGYWRRAGQTAEKYIADPFSADGARLYRTGDLARWLPDGQIAFLGRIDHQVKVRGMRIELGEIEAELLSLPGVKEAVVLAQPMVEAGTGADTVLVAYISLKHGIDLGARSLRDELQSSLPGHMVPNGIVVLHAMPLSPNGKLDRQALPQWQAATSEAKEAPKGDVEQTLASIWGAVLRVQAVGRHDNFFELGGSSMTVLEVQIKVHKQMGVQLPVRHYFEHPTLAAIAAVLHAESSRQGQVSVDLDAMDALLESLGN